MRMYNEACTQDLFYKPLNQEKIIQTFYKKESTDIYTYVYDMDGIKGFISGVLQDDKAYITFIYVRKELRGQGIGNQLYQAIYNEFKGVKIEMVFFNPQSLPWLIENEFIHPNAPGIDSGSLAIPFFMKRGFKEFAEQNVYFRKLSEFEYSKPIIESFKRLEKDNITFGFYDYKSDIGIEELMDNLKNEGWKKEILDHIHTYKEDNKVIVAKKDNLAIGFTGPIKNVEGRGYFAGIGVHSDYRSFGVGKALFNKLCYELKQISNYMSLFTGVNNKARYIYESAGFEIVRTFINMRRDV